MFEYNGGINVCPKVRVPKTISTLGWKQVMCYKEKYESYGRCMRSWKLKVVKIYVHLGDDICLLNGVL